MIISVFSCVINSSVLFESWVNTAGRDHMLLIEVQSVVDKTDHGICTHIDHNNGKYVTILSSKSH